MQGQRGGYVRVSTFEQNTQRQLNQVPVDRLFTDKASGKDAQRPELELKTFYVSNIALALAAPLAAQTTRDRTA